MNFRHRAFGLVQALAVILSLAIPLVVVASSADARVGGGSSSGSRGGRTFSAPPTTPTAPTAAQPFNRTATQPGSPGSPAGGGFFNRPGMGLFGGLAAGFLGAGLLGMLFGGGLFGGIGGFSSILGLLLQVGLIVLLARWAMSWWQRRSETQAAYAGAPSPVGAQTTTYSSGMSGFGLGSGSAPLQIQPADYEAFERLLGEVQQAWSDEDVGRYRSLATPEMVTYFARDLEENKSRNVINKVAGTKLLQGDLAEAWREGESDYASVAMRYSVVDTYVDRASGRVVEGNGQPEEVTEVWTFVRPRGANWEVSAIQQTS
jgi:predicted lipid-binding transport protein (Tim44 family)